MPVDASPVDARTEVLEVVGEYEAGFVAALVLADADVQQLVEDDADDVSIVHALTVRLEDGDREVGGDGPPVPVGHPRTPVEDGTALAGLRLVAGEVDYLRVSVADVGERLVDLDGPARPPCTPR